MKFEKYKLEDVCEYVNDRISIDKVTLKNYISTENLLPEKGGKKRASSLPKAKTIVSYQKGDTLISNIRPYFKKIWFSNTDGGSSSDVLVFRSNKKINAVYLYYFLSQNKVFDYMVQTSKGTKMPRGDKEALMKYPISLPVLEYQKKVSDMLSNIDKKIELNNFIISNLEELAQALFKHWFVDFEFPNENGQPYKSSGGKMVESELGMIPSNFKVSEIKDFCELKYGKALTKKNRIPGPYPVYGSGGITGTHNSYLVEGTGLILGRKGSIGTLYLEPDNFFPIDTVFYLVSEKYSTLYLYTMFNQFDFTKSNNDSAVPGLNRNAVYNTKIATPPDCLAKQFGEILNPIFQTEFKLKDENKLLIELRDTLLPKLLSGEIELPETKEVIDNVPVS